MEITIQGSIIILIILINDMITECWLSINLISVFQMLALCFDFDLCFDFAFYGLSCFDTQGPVSQCVLVKSL